MQNQFTCYLFKKIVFGCSDFLITIIQLKKCIAIFSFTVIKTYFLFCVIKMINRKLDQSQNE